MTTSKSSSAKPANKPRLLLRNATPQDIPAIHALTAKAYAALGPQGNYTTAQLRGHQHHFPQGQFVAIYDNRDAGSATE